MKDDEKFDPCEYGKSPEEGLELLYRSQEKNTSEQTLHKGKKEKPKMVPAYKREGVGRW